MPRMTPTQIDRMNEAVKALLKVEEDYQTEVGFMDQIPLSWHWMEEDGPRWKKKEKITLRLDEETVKFFKGLGPGYQTKLNLILRAYVEMRRARFLKGREAGQFFFDDHEESGVQRALREDDERDVRNRGKIF